MMQPCRIYLHAIISLVAVFGVARTVRMPVARRDQRDGATPFESTDWSKGGTEEMMQPCLIYRHLISLVCASLVKRWSKAALKR